MSWGQLAQLAQDLQSTQAAPTPNRDLATVMADHIAWTQAGNTSDLGLPPVYAAVRLVATSIDQMTLTTDGPMPGWLENPRRLGAQFDQGDMIQYMVTSMLLNGAAYLQATRAGLGWLLEPLPYDQVHVRRSTSGPVRLSFAVDGQDMPRLPWRPQDRTRDKYLIHIPYLVTTDRPEGLSPMQAARITFRNFTDVENAAANLLSGGTFVGGRLETDKDITGTFAKEMQRGWMEARKTGNIPVLGGGLRYSETRLSMSESQMLETRSWHAVLVCSVFGIPPAMLGYSMAGGESSLSYQNATDMKRWLRTNALALVTTQMSDALSELTNVGNGPNGVIPNPVRFDFTEWEEAGREDQATDQPAAPAL